MWDLDGVACEWVEPFYKKLCEWENLEPTEWLTWHHYRNHDITDEHFVARLHQYADEGGFGDQIPVPGFAEAVKQIDAARISQHVVSDRPESALADTEWWIDTFAPEIATLTLSRDKTVFKQYGTPTYYAIDDRVENVEKMRKAGIFAYLLRRTWNEDSDLPHVASLQDFVHIVTGNEFLYYGPVTAADREKGAEVANTVTGN